MFSSVRTTFKQPRLAFIIKISLNTYLQIAAESYIKNINTYNNEELLESRIREITILKLKLISKFRHHCYRAG